MCQCQLVSTASKWLIKSVIAGLKVTAGYLKKRKHVGFTERNQISLEQITLHICQRLYENDQWRSVGGMSPTRRPCHVSQVSCSRFDKLSEMWSLTYQAIALSELIHIYFHEVEFGNCGKCCSAQKPQSWLILFTQWLEYSPFCKVYHKYSHLRYWRRGCSSEGVGPKKILIMQGRVLLFHKMKYEIQPPSPH